MWMPKGTSIFATLYQELAILVGMPVKLPTQHHARLLVAGLGQIASPIQSSWIYGVIREHLLHQQVGSKSRETCFGGINRVCQTLLNMRNALFPAEVHTLGMTEFERRLRQVLLHVQPAIAEHCSCE